MCGSDPDDTSERHRGSIADLAQWAITEYFNRAGDAASGSIAIGVVAYLLDGRFDWLTNVPPLQTGAGIALVLGLVAEPVPHHWERLRFRRNGKRLIRSLHAEAVKEQATLILNLWQLEVYTTEEARAALRGLHRPHSRVTH